MTNLVPHLAQSWLSLFSLLIITIITYFPTRHFPFNFDDLGNIIEKFNIRTFSVWEKIFTNRRWFGEWLNALIFQFDGFTPQYYRLCNIAIHLLAGTLVYLLIRWACRQSSTESVLARQRHTITLLTTALFLLHPVQTQTISYAIQGKLEGAASVLILLSLYSMVNALTQKGFFARVLCTVLGIASGVVACGTKEIAIVAPALLVLLDWFFIATTVEQHQKRLWWHVIYSAAIGLIMVYYFKPSFLLTIFQFKTALPNNRGNTLTAVSTGTITPYFYCISQFKVLVHYLAMFLWPFGISVEYDWKLCSSLFALDAYAPLMLLSLMVWFVLRKKYRTSAPHLLFATLVFATMAPRKASSPLRACDYKTYLASVGWLFIIAVGIIQGVEYLLARQVFHITHRAAYYSLLCCSTLGLATATYQRNQVWKSGEAFWFDVICKAPYKARAHNNYGVELVKTANQLSREGKKAQANALYARAITSYQQALLIEPYYADAYSNLSVAYTVLNDLDKAIEVATRAITLFPNYPEAHINLGTQYLEKEYALAKSTLKMRSSIALTTDRHTTTLRESTKNKNDMKNHGRHWSVQAKQTLIAAPNAGLPLDSMPAP